ncbi:MAG: hypothetical protein OXG98_02975 [Gemmatimonadetes bacterium]|nr:hypothetical protein [Gemmatimonadota bacterium]
MKRKIKTSGISRFLQRNPAWSQVVCIVGVSLLVILGPILLYGLFFQPESDVLRVLSKIPWWPVVLLVLLVAVLSLLQGAAGVSVQKRSAETQDADGDDETIDLPTPPPSKPETPPSSRPPDAAGPGSDPLRFTRSGQIGTRKRGTRLMR